MLSGNQSTQDREECIDMRHPETERKSLRVTRIVFAAPDFPFEGFEHTEGYRRNRFRFFLRAAGTNPAVLDVNFGRSTPPRNCQSMMMAAGTVNVSVRNFFSACRSDVDNFDVEG